MSSNKKLKDATFATEVTSTLPRGKATWEVLLDDPLDVYDDLAFAKVQLLFANLGYDLVGAAMAKLGWEYSQFVTGESDRETFDTKMAGVLSTLTAR